VKDNRSRVYVLRVRTCPCVISRIFSNFARDRGVHGEDLQVNIALDRELADLLRVQGTQPTLIHVF